MQSPKIRRIDPGSLSLDPIREAAQWISGGGVVVFPTTGLYGLGANALDPKAVENVFRVKHRPTDKPLSILVKDRISMDGLVRDISAAAQAVMDRFWPGSVTTLFQADDRLPKVLTAGTGKIGVRIPAHPVAAALVDLIDFPLTATSANIAGGPSCSRIQDLDPQILDRVDLVLDAGALRGGMGSTVVDVSVDPARVLREGAISIPDLMEAIDNPH